MLSKYAVGKKPNATNRALEFRYTNTRALFGMLGGCYGLVECIRESKIKKDTFISTPDGFLVFLGLIIRRSTMVQYIFIKLKVRKEKNGERILKIRSGLS